jgi:hypothetical protein
VFTVLPHENGTNIRNAERDEGQPGEGRGKSRRHAGKFRRLARKGGGQYKAWREKIAAETEAIKARTRAIRENMGTSHKEMVAVIKPGRNMETIACQEMEAHPEEEKPASVDTPCESGTENANRQEDVLPCNNGTNQERHPQGEHDLRKVSTAEGTSR